MTPARSPKVVERLRCRRESARVGRGSRGQAGGSPAATMPSAAAAISGRRRPGDPRSRAAGARRSAARAEPAERPPERPDARSLDLGPGRRPGSRRAARGRAAPRRPTRQARKRRGRRDRVAQPGLGLAEPADPARASARRCARVESARAERKRNAASAWPNLTLGSRSGRCAAAPESSIRIQPPRRRVCPRFFTCGIDESSGVATAKRISFYRSSSA